MLPPPGHRSVPLPRRPSSGSLCEHPHDISIATPPEGRIGTTAQRCSERVIVVADDEDIVRRYMVRALAEAGFRTVEVHDGHEALALLTRLGPALVWLVVSDVAMPGVSGTQLVTAVAQRWPRLPVLLVSGRPPLDYRGPFLGKPFTVEALVASVERLLPPPAGYPAGPTAG